MKRTARNASLSTCRMQVLVRVPDARRFFEEYRGQALSDGAWRP